MASITNQHLQVATIRPNVAGSAVVTCDVEFTEFEVNAMNVLGLQFELHCELVETGLLEGNSIHIWPTLMIPGDVAASRSRTAVFETHLTVAQISQRLIGPDKLAGYLTLRNVETNETLTANTETRGVNFARG
jgi:hypothetical protein